MYVVYKFNSEEELFSLVEDPNLTVSTVLKISNDLITKIE